MIEKKGLYGQDRFPQAVGNVAWPCARPIGKFRFGLDQDNTAASLRALADAIEAGEALPQTVVHHTKAAQDDFVIDTLIIKFASQRPV